MTTYIYEVYVEGPAGSYPIGFFKYQKHAKACKEDWDGEHYHPFDQAIIVKHKLRGRYVRK